MALHILSSLSYFSALLNDIFLSVLDIEARPRLKHSATGEVIHSAVCITRAGCNVLDACSLAEVEFQGRGFHLFGQLLLGTVGSKCDGNAVVHDMEHVVGALQDTRSHWYIGTCREGTLQQTRIVWLADGDARTKHLYTIT